MPDVELSSNAVVFGRSGYLLQLGNGELRVHSYSEVRLPRRLSLISPAEQRGQSVANVRVFEIPVIVTGFVAPHSGERTNTPLLGIADDSRGLMEVLDGTVSRLAWCTAPTRGVCLVQVLAVDGLSYGSLREVVHCACVMGPGTRLVTPV